MDNAWRKSFKMVIKRLKILPPTLRDKRRYVKIRIICEKEGCYKKFMEEFLRTIEEFYGDFQLAWIDLKPIRNLCKNNTFIFRCFYKAVPYLILALGLIYKVENSRVIIKIEGVSGTLKKLKK